MNVSLVEVQDTEGAAAGGGGQAVRVRRLKLNRADKANALSAEMMKNLAHAVSDQSADVHVLYSAHERLFCAGADISEFLESELSLAAQEHALLALIEQLSSSQVPLIAIVRGKVSGAGAVLVALADVVLASDDAELACPEVRFGMYPVIVDAVLSTRISPALSQRMCLGQSLDAVQAWQAGLISEVIPAHRFDALVQERLNYFIDRASALSIARQCRLSMTTPQDISQKVRGIAPLMAANYRSSGVRERIAAYLSRLGGRAGRVK